MGPIKCNKGFHRCLRALKEAIRGASFQCITSERWNVTAEIYIPRGRKVGHVILVQLLPTGQPVFPPPAALEIRPGDFASIDPAWLMHQKAAWHPSLLVLRLSPKRRAAPANQPL
jgi:hypothetical protein